jgi:hypothetical protein
MFNKLTAEDMGNTDLIAAITKGMKAPYAAMGDKADALYKMAMAEYLKSPGKQVQGLSALGKSYMEPYLINQKNASMGYGAPQDGSMDQPTNNNPYGDNTTGNNNEVDDRYDLYRQKVSTDAQARNRSLFASNIEKTLSFINPKDLTRYSGFQGGLQRLLEKGKSSIGKESDDYDRYVQAMNASNFLAKQIRQFYGDSIQPSMMQNLELITNPTSWDKKPQLAEKVFNQTTDILSKEIETYRKSMGETSQYTGKNSSSGNQNPVAQQDDEVFTIFDPSGKAYAEGNEAQVSAFLKDHPNYTRRLNGRS